MERRDFLKRLGLITGAGAAAFFMDRTPVKAFSRPFLNITNPDGKALVLLQLNGGNDGLNTVIPFEDDIYYNKRPVIGISKDKVVKLNELTGLHPSLLPFKNIYDEGSLTVVQSVGYENPNRSHFRATDIWLSASGSGKFQYDGWIGRYLADIYPGFPDKYPAEPMAVQLGSVQSLLLESPRGSTGVSFESPAKYYELIKGAKVEDEPSEGTLRGEELKFLRQMASQSLRYASVIKEKAGKAKNLVEYPNTKLGHQLAIIAELISGGLETPCYLASLGSFDTHAGQAAKHAPLLTQLAGAVSAFQQDIKLHGLEDKVVLITFSEFGRRLNENGSHGTDHGTAAPMFLIGKNTAGGIVGSNPDLTNLDSSGDIIYKYDYRQVYATLLKEHFGMQQKDVDAVLLNQFNALPLLRKS